MMQESPLNASDAIPPIRACIRCETALADDAAFCSQCGSTQGAELSAPNEIEKANGLWCNGGLLVAHKKATFPPRCVKTNLPTTHFVRRKLTWMHPGYWSALVLLCLCWPVGLIAVALVFGLGTKRAVLDIPVIDEVLARQRLLTIKCMIAIAAAFIFFPLGFLISDDLAIIAGLPFVVVIGITGSVYVPLVSVQRIDTHYIYIKGVSADFLRELPRI